MRFETISANKIEEYVSSNIIIIDLRSWSDYKKGHIPKAINIPYEDFEMYKGQIARNKTLILYCERGGISTVLARDLSQEGYIVKNIYGGINAYRGDLEF